MILSNAKDTASGIFKNITRDFKGIYLPTNEVTKEWDKMKRPNTISKMIDLMKKFNLKDNDIYKAFKAIGYDLNEDDMKKKDVNTSSILTPMINKKNLVKLSNTLGSVNNIKHFIRRLTKSIKDLSINQNS